ncbi:MAG: hypothetical protein LBH71_02725 [Oscillospiraceae bacterium]|nr:hypothetical protein [Oscillospiraceae bacterium]
MQQDAIERVHQMQKHANIAAMDDDNDPAHGAHRPDAGRSYSQTIPSLSELRGRNSGPKHHEHVDKPPIKTEPQIETIPPLKKPVKNKFFDSFNLSGLMNTLKGFASSDYFILLGLVALLMSDEDEEVDHLLVLAILYIMMD